MQCCVYTRGGVGWGEHEVLRLVCVLFVQAVVGSSFIPCFSGYIPPVFRGKVSTAVHVVQFLLV